MVAKRNHHTPSKSFCELNKVVRILQTVDQRHRRHIIVYIFVCLITYWNVPSKGYFCPTERFITSHTTYRSTLLKIYCHLKNCNKCYTVNSFHLFALFVKILSQKFGKFLLWRNFTFKCITELIHFFVNVIVMWIQFLSNSFHVGCQHWSIGSHIKPEKEKMTNRNYTNNLQVLTLPSRVVPIHKRLQYPPQKFCLLQGNFSFRYPTKSVQFDPKFCSFESNTFQVLPCLLAFHSNTE